MNTRPFTVDPISISANADVGCSSRIVVEFRISVFVDFIQAINFQILTFIQINIYQGDFIEKESILFINYLKI